MGEPMKRYSFSDFRAFPKDNRRNEIIGGRWIVTPTGDPGHQNSFLKLFPLLLTHAGANGLGQILQNATVVLGDSNVVVPDLMLIAPNRGHIVTAEGLTDAPDLLIEVTSPASAAIDRGLKVDLYRDRGAREYWIVDPAARIIEVHEFHSRMRWCLYRPGEKFESSLLPNLVVLVEGIV